MWGLLVVGLGSTVVAPFAAYVALLLVAGGLSSSMREVGAQVIGNWVCVAAIVAIVVRAERLPLSSIGIRSPRWRDVGLGVAFWLAAIVFTIVSVAVVRPDVDSGPVELLLALPIGFRIVLFVTASVTEEVLFRGYALERVASLFGSIGAGAVITCIAFVAVHAPFYGAGESLLRLPIAIGLTVLYVRTRSLWSVIVMHALVDVPLLFAGSG